MHRMYNEEYHIVVAFLHDRVTLIAWLMCQRCKTSLAETHKLVLKLTQPRRPQYSSAIQSTLLTLHSLPFTDTAENANLQVIAHYAIFLNCLG